jgi:hypothetical protein
MRKIALIISGLIFLAAALAACFDKKDFEFDKFTVSDLEPTLYLPLLNDTIRLDASGDYNVLYDENGMGYLHFDVGNDILPPVSDFFEVPDATYSVAGTSFTYSGSGASLTVSPQTHTAEYYFAQPDQQVDSIVFKSGRVTFSLASAIAASGYYKITVPGLQRNGVPFDVTLPYDGAPYSSDIAGWTLKFKNGNTFDVVVELTILTSTAPAGDYNFDADIAFSNVDIKSVHGYFGRQTAMSLPVSVGVSAFDNFRNNATTVLRIKEAFLHFRVDNGAGFPVRLRIDEVTSTAGGQLKRFDVDSVIIPPNEPQQAFFRSEHRIGGEAFGEAVSNMPSSMEFKFSGTINPEGSRGGTVKNFLTDISAITMSRVEVRIPLHFSVSGMTLKDTLSFNSSKVTFNDMELLLNIENNMPVKVDLQAFLMDEDDRVLGPLFTAPVEIPSAETDAATGIVTAPHLYVQKIEANIAQLAQTRKVKVDIAVNTNNPASEFVRVMKDNYVYLRIGAKTRVNIDNLD